MGHTHEDIDQVFSRVSTRLKHMNVLSLQGMIVQYILNLVHFIYSLTIKFQTYRKQSGCPFPHLLLFQWLIVCMILPAG